MDSLRLFLLTLFFPLLVIGMLWRRPRRPLGAWLATLFLALGVTGFTLLASPWGWFGLPMRYALLAALVLAMVFSLRRAVPEESKPESPLRTIVKVLLGFYFGGVALGALRGHEVPPAPIELAFPLRGGVYLVAHGGSTGPSNMYNPDAAQRYAVDFVKLNGAGMRARGLYPKELERYAIFGAEVLSPCSGGVLAVVDGLPDQTPGTFDDKHPAGNQVVIRCGDVAVTLAHLQKGSVAARVGTRVTASQLLGRAGNSGRSSEPHLHVHAERGGKAVPARFGGKWLVRNDVVRLPPQSSILNPQSSILNPVPHPSSLAFPSDNAPMTTDPFLQAAIDEARLGLEEGGIPIGSVLVHEGKIIGRGHNRRIQKGSATLHGEMDALENAGRLAARVYRESTIYTTLSPCAMCSGAILLYGISRVIAGENQTFLGEEELLRSRGVSVEVLQDDECIALMSRFIAEHPELWYEDIGR